MLTLYAFGTIFEDGIGETKDLRAQWALEETGLPYRVHALDHTGGELDGEAYGRISPFRQVPAIDDDGFVVAGREWIASDGFTAADILLACVLRSVRKTDLLDPFPALKAYYARCFARPAWERTLAMYAERPGVTVEQIR